MGKALRSSLSLRGAKRRGNPHPRCPSAILLPGIGRVKTLPYIPLRRGQRPRRPLPHHRHLHRATDSSTPGYRMNCGMLATGKHIHFRFAARSTTLRMTWQWRWLSSLLCHCRERRDAAIRIPRYRHPICRGGYQLSASSDTVGASIARPCNNCEAIVAVFEENKKDRCLRYNFVPKLPDDQWSPLHVFDKLKEGALCQCH